MCLTTVVSAWRIGSHDALDEGEGVAMRIANLLEGRDSEYAKRQVTKEFARLRKAVSNGVVPEVQTEDVEGGLGSAVSSNVAEDDGEGGQSASCDLVHWAIGVW